MIFFTPFTRFAIICVAIGKQLNLTELDRIKE